ncbi:hypothetical protein C7B62_22435 [Pleurocapsa sp. CCALA 161]|uniref:class I SAM-dependent DNA methyltransferase n=1 Tax=Pleurocapsa sp. CCALA 161 TaxID=2107688 RepID=UPI000D083AB4|nr:class I SAM-dependent DNA methyltransferase [Pleurocapsa sp. CCALA 161]PSB06598.1 hypothetical protein C7B62_22435 [Pleurocapsa sp. CCALA 161]
MPANTTDLEKRLWDAADELRANSKLKSSEYSVPVLGLIFLRYADYRFTKAEQELKSKGSSRRGVSKADYQAKGVMYLPDIARFSYLVNLPESEDTGKAINESMKAIEAENEELSNIFPQTYNRFENSLLVELLKSFNQIDIDTDLEGDAFGKIYEYFLGKFAMSEGQKGGEFFTPTSIVKLIVEILEPYHGRIYDPACGSGGMFVQSASFVARHQKNPSAEISIYGQEKVNETVRLCKMNIAVNGLSGDIREGNSYYEDIHKGINKFDFVMANPPFNVDKIDVAGLCNVATIDQIKEQGWSLNPGRYVGVAEKEQEDFDFAERLEELNEELEILNSEARELEERIAENVNKLLEKNTL